MPPASEERRRAEANPAPLSGDVDLIERFAHCGSLEELPPELRHNPFVQYLLGMTTDEQAHEVAATGAHREAEALYGDDPERILAAIEAGAHPLQRLQSRR